MAYPRPHQNLKCVDLRDLKGPLPLDVASSRQILWQTEDWEYSTWGDPDRREDSVGYPTVVQNDRGPHPDGLYYLFYAHHDPNSGIGGVRLPNPSKDPIASWQSGMLAGGTARFW